MVVPLYFSTREMLHVPVPLASLRKAPLFTAAGLCAPKPSGRYKIPCRPLPHRSSLMVSEQAQALQRFWFSARKEQENFAFNDCHLYKLCKRLLCFQRILYIECEKQHGC